MPSPHSWKGRRQCSPPTLSSSGLYWLMQWVAVRRWESSEKHPTLRFEDNFENGPRYHLCPMRASWQFYTTPPVGGVLGWSWKLLGYIATVSIPNPNQLPLRIYLKHLYFCTKKKILGIHDSNYFKIHPYRIPTTILILFCYLGLITFAKGDGILLG